MVVTFVIGFLDKPMPQPSPKQPTILITGASSGIGRACTLALAQQGFTVYAGHRNPADGDALKAENPSHIQPILLDVTVPDTIQAVFDQLKADLGNQGLYGLLNNAGIVVPGPLAYLPMALIRQQFEVNVFGLIAVTQAMLPLLRQGKTQNPEAGRIVNISSVSGLRVTPLMGAYAASKFSVEAISDGLRMELSPWGLQVAVIEPGVIQTPILGKIKDQANSLNESLPTQAQKDYGHWLTLGAKRFTRYENSAPTTNVVADAVTQAFVAKHPKTRYLVGKPSSHIEAWLFRWLPDRLKDKLILNKLFKHEPIPKAD